MKEVFETKNKLYFFSLILFLFVDILILIFDSINSIFFYIIFPFLFFILTFTYSKNNKIEWEIPVILMIIYMIMGYFFLFDYMSAEKIIFSFLIGELANILLLLLNKFKLHNKILQNKKELKIPSEEFKDIKNKRITYYLPLVFVTILEIYYRMCTFGIRNFKFEILSFLITIIIIYIIYLLILSIVRSTHTANITFSIFILIIYIINQLRIFYTSDTLQITDIQFLNTTGELTNFVDVTLISAIKYILPPTFIVVVIFAWLLSISKKNDTRHCNKKENLIVFFTSLFALFLLFAPIKSINRFVLKHVFNYGNESDYTITVSNTKFYYKYGVISGMYGKFIEKERFEPKNYDENKLQEILKNTKRKEASWGRPNVIVLFSESFWDLSQLKGVKFNKDIQSNFHSLQNKGKLINMITPSYGGISANVEFEILTGASLNYFSKGYIPYMQLFNKGKSENNPNIIREFKNNGYKSIILNSSSKVMFNCDRVYDFYDVDERTHLYDELELGGAYVSDKYITDRIIDYFDNKDKDEKTFYFAITMGGHMPYYEERYDSYDFDIKSEYSDDVNGSIKAYAEGMYLADQELGRLYDYINTLDENTIIVFFGDHLPQIQTVLGKDALFETGYLNRDYNLESVYRQFNTNALILSNYEINHEEIKYLGPDVLFTYIMNNMNLELSDYYKWLYTTIDTLPSSNQVVSIDKSGILHYTLALDGEMKDTYELRKKMQYMLFR